MQHMKIPPILKTWGKMFPWQMLQVMVPHTDAKNKTANQIKRSHPTGKNQAQSVWRTLLT